MALSAWGRDADIKPSDNAERIVIDSVKIVTEDVFDLDRPKYDNFLFKLANQMHIVTRHTVIRRELLLGQGDVYDTALVNESIRNLRQLPYLLKTDIHLEQGPGGENIMVVTTSDKWTTVGGLSFHRTGGRDDLQVGIEENNLLGYGVFMSQDYMIVEDDRNFYQMEIADHRFWGWDLAVDFFYSDNPRAGQKLIMIGRPFYTLDQKWSGMMNYRRLKRRLDYYDREQLVARDYFDKIDILGQIDFRFGPKHIKYTLEGTYRYIDLDAGGQEIILSVPSYTLPPSTQDSLYHYGELTAGIRQIKYRVFERLNRFHKPEDINLGLDARVSYGQARKPGLKRPLYHFWEVWPQYSAAFGSHLVIAGMSRQHWYEKGKCLRKRVNYYFKYYMQYHNNHTFALGVRFLSDHLSEPAYTLYLDEDQGMRGYPAFILNGEDRLIINIENRFFSDIEILTVGIGGVAFADIGSIWSRDKKPTLEETQTALGAGLRFGISRSTQGEIIRIDCAYAPQRRDWQISVGTGQFF